MTVADAIVVPLVAAIACAVPIAGLARSVAVISGLLVTAIVAAVALAGLPEASETYVWASPLGARLAIGLDGWSAASLMLGGILFAVGAAASAGVRSPRAYFALWSLFHAAAVGVFVARDLILFFACWEALLVPVALLLWGWGGADRRAVTLRLLSYWMTGSALLLTGIVALGVGARTFSFADLAVYRLAERSQVALAALFLVAFAVRLPLFPFHAWLVRTYVAAPLALAIPLAGVVPATAVYAIARVALPLFPRGMADLAPYLVALAALGALLGAILASRQRDTRAFIAYGGLAQVDLAAVGVFAGSTTGLQGALIASVSHGLVAAALFLLAASLARRLGTFGLGPGGLAARAPVLMALFVLAIAAAIGVPGTSGAPGELLVLAAAFARWPGLGLLATIVTIASAAYGVGFMRSVFFGPSAHEGTDVGWRERALVIPILVLIVAVGIAPGAVAELAR